MARGRGYRTRYRVRLGTEISYLAGKGRKAAGVDRSGAAVGRARRAHGVTRQRDGTSGRHDLGTT